mgnify:CR=1 FL=1
MLLEYRIFTYGDVTITMNNIENITARSKTACNTDKKTVIMHSKEFGNKQLLLFDQLEATPATVIWLKYCRYGVKPYTINQSINHHFPLGAVNRLERMELFQHRVEHFLIH